MQRTSMLKVLLKYNQMQENVLDALIFIARIFERAGQESRELLYIFIYLGYDYTRFLLPTMLTYNNTYSIPMSYILYTKQLKHLLLNGVAVDYRQLPGPLILHSHEEVSFLHWLVLCITHSVFRYDSYVYADMCMAALYILHQCGANLWDRHTYGITQKTAYEYLRQKVFDSNDPSIYSNDTKKFMKSYMQNLMNEPLSLQSQCRICLLRKLRSRYLKTIDKLVEQLPNSIISFLRGSDMKDV